MGKGSISLSDFREASGRRLEEKTQPYFTWQAQRRAEGNWIYDKTLLGAPKPQGDLRDGCGRTLSGPNYCSQDYLSLADHPAVKAAAIEAIRELGVHSAGSSALLGNTLLSRRLEEHLAEFVSYEHVLLFPTGWAAGYGVVKGLVRPDDWVVMDALSHACLQEGAKAATRNVVSIPHLDHRALEQRLGRVRASNPDAFILVVTESIFSMDSDSPDLAAWLDVCKRYEATSLVDIAHDLGCLGPTGGGQLEIQGCSDVPDLLIGSFSKTFASNGGFIATHDPAVKEYLKMFSCPQTFSNAMSPVQAATILSTLSIVGSQEGLVLRDQLYENSLYLRTRLESQGFLCMGQPSAIVPVYLGDDGPARTLWTRLSDSGISSNLVEFPGVATNRSRIRLQVQSAHRPEHADLLVERLVEARQDSTRLQAAE